MSRIKDESEQKETNLVKEEAKYGTWNDISDEFREWGESTTLHGVPIIFRAPNLALRLFWLAIFLTSTALCCFMLVTTFQNYFSYEVITKIRSVPKRTLPLGSFTFCNERFFNTHEAFELVSGRFREKFNINVSNLKDLINYSKKLNFNWYNELERLKTEVLIKGIANSSLVEKYGYSVDDFFYKKTFNNENIEKGMIKRILDPFWGNCFKINYDRELAKHFEVNKPDVTMHIVMFSGTANPLSNTYTKNIEIEIDSKIDYPFTFKTNFLNAGKHTNIVLSRKRVLVEPKPYSECVDVEKNPPEMLNLIKQLGITYSREVCINFYYQYLINKELKCFDPYNPIFPNNLTEACDPTQPIMDYIFRKVDESICPQECERNYVLSSTSSDLFPTRSYAQEMLMRRPEYFERVFNKSVNEITYEMIRDNFCSVSIRFDSLSVTELTEEPALTFVGLISNLGGIVGLFIAISVLSFMEFIDLGVTITIILSNSFRIKNNHHRQEIINK